ncbi:DUF3040 domain-containing protein [Agromyces mariniharenae]|uniref:DUF3040 domain-containing protein n=1 Tax=Agromyces mariniharenae TaxID=2604423 RepID=A0A5S4UX05_9MICO|nr:DUF3040 domain-containing protein [Agromyces mariniharenae]TYL51092.1 DUF3040 domain-containing protein [Agromyces mariniharenae]
MPLSEQEQRLLEEMERNLYRNDADFVHAVGGVRGRRPNYRSIVLGVLLAVAGIGALIAGVALQLLIVGVIGFALMFGGVLLAITPGKRGATAPAPAEPTAGSPKGKRSGGGFMDRLNDRWDRRQEGRD